MLDIKQIRKDPDPLVQSLTARRSDIDANIFLSLDQQRRAMLTEVETLKSKRNTASAEVAAVKRAGGNPEAQFAELGQLSDQIKELDAKVAEVDERLTDWLLSVPNIPHESVPRGRDEHDNVEVRRHLEPRKFDFTPKEHWELGVQNNIMDFERAVKISKSRFTFLRGAGSRLERALVNFFLDVQTRENGYTEMSPPLIVNRQTLIGTGNLPKFEEDLFRLDGKNTNNENDLYLIPTAEVPLTNLYAGEILSEDELPYAFCAQTPCFRSEAGSYGKDTKGLIRQHQFTKVEMVRICHPDESWNQLELMRGHAENLLERLELPYRTIVLCTGDMGFASAKTYDVEVWLPGQNTYREISSCSNCTDFQARRANIRWRDSKGKLHFVHTLNGSGLPIGRTITAILENGQNEDGSITIPKVLRPYMDGVETICFNPQSAPSAD